MYLYEAIHVGQRYQHCKPIYNSTEQVTNIANLYFIAMREASVVYIL